MNIGKLAKSLVRTIKKNPDKALILATLIAPSVVTKVAPKVIPVVEALGKKREA